MNYLKVCYLLILGVNASNYSVAQTKFKEPIDYIKLVADRVIVNSSLKMRASIDKPQQAFQQIETIDFGRSFYAFEGTGYAYSILESDDAMPISFQISHTDELKIWINDKEVYRKEGINLPIVEENERAWGLKYSFTANLEKGANKILIKSSIIKGQDWKVRLQPLLPLPEEGDVEKGREPLKFSLASDSSITKQLAAITNWIIIGPFKPDNFNSGSALSNLYPPETEILFGKIYRNSGKDISWQLPKIELVTDVYKADPLWGSLYDWNYHTAGVAWAIGNLGQYTAEQKYTDYLDRYCRFMIDIKPYIYYEKYGKNRLSSRFSRMWNTQLLDFSAAPTLPFIYSLVSNPALRSDNGYLSLVKNTKEYMLKRQLRLEDGTLARETPFKYTLWVDDMFMGIPFLLQMAEYANSPAEKAMYLNDAANQVVQFNKRLYNKSVNLYHHAWFSARPQTKLPYWSRANGWGIWASSEVLLHLPKNHPLYKPILSIYKNHIAGIVKYQNTQTGFYPNLLDEPDSYKETSGTAIFTMAIARGINNGWLDKKMFAVYAERGWKALTSVISDTGEVTDICMGTMCSEDKDYYRNRPVVKNDSHGLLGLIFSGIEMQKLTKGTAK